MERDIEELQDEVFQLREDKVHKQATLAKHGELFFIRRISMIALSLLFRILK